MESGFNGLFEPITSSSFVHGCLHTLISEMHKHTYLDSFMQNIILELLNNSGSELTDNWWPEFDVTAIVQKIQAL